jgi:hypothetical protein
VSAAQVFGWTVAYTAAVSGFVLFWIVVAHWMDDHNWWRY